MKIKIEIKEDEKAVKNYMKASSRESFVFFISPGKYDKKNNNHRSDLVKELNYQLRNYGVEKLDIYSLRSELDKLDSNKPVWIEIKDKEI